MIKLALSLEITQRLGVVNRDLKPENILIDQNGHITVLDFGFALLKSRRSIGVDRIFKAAEEKAIALAEPEAQHSTTSKENALHKGRGKKRL